jgi:hypothetical protein
VSFPTGWAHRVPIAVDHTQIDSDLTDFTVVITDEMAAVLSAVDGPLDADGTRPSINGGGDVRFSADEAGTQRLAVDVREWVTNNNPASGSLEVAVRVPTVSSSTDTTIYLWWGKAGETQPAPGDPFGQYAAYDAHHRLVSTDGGLTDRTSAANNGVGFNVPSIPGVIGDAVTLGGTGSRITLPVLGVNSNEMTISALLYPTDLSGDAFNDDNPRTLLIGRQDGDLSTLPYFVRFRGRQIDLLFSSTGGQLNVFRSNDEFDWGVGPMVEDAWQHVFLCRSTGALLVLHNGVTQPMFTVQGDLANTTPFAESTPLVGATRPADDYRIFKGNIDELRISTVARRAEWGAAEYANLLAPATLLTAGAITDVSTSDELTGADISAATVIDSPAIGQSHALTGTDTTALTAIDAPTIGQLHGLTTDAIAASTTVETPTLQSVAGVDSLTGVDLVALIAVDSPTIEQDHQLTGADIASLTVIDAPTLQSIAGVDPLTGQDIAAGSAVSTPTIGQVHVIDGADLIGGVTVDAPALGQVHLLTGTGIMALSDISEPALIIGAVYEILELHASFTREIEMQASFTREIEMQAQFAGGNA